MTKIDPLRTTITFTSFEVIQNFFFSSKVATTGKTHIRDKLDIQRVMVVVVWLTTFPAMFWGMYSMGFWGLDYMQEEDLILPGTGIIVLYKSLAQDPGNHLHRFWFGLVYFVPIYLTVFYSWYCV